MNALGFITVDSIDAVGGGNLYSHSMVSGFMLPESLLRLKNNSNLLGPHVGFIHHIIRDTEWSDDEFRRISLPLQYYEDDEGGFSQCNVKLFYSHLSIQHIKKMCCLSQEEEVEYVTFIDMNSNLNPNSEKGLFTSIIKALAEMILLPEAPSP
jgi:hypothetical protein